MNLWSQDKGQEAEVKAFVQAISNGHDAPIPMGEIMEVTKVTIELAGNNR